MAWNNPTNTSVGQIWTSAKVVETYDNLRYLKGQAGTVQIENNVNFGAASIGASTRLGIGANGSGARTSYIDLAGDDTWGDGLRMIRDAAGTSRIVHRGTADFQIQTIEAAAMWFRTNSALRGGWSAAGNWGIGTTSPQALIHVRSGATNKDLISIFSTVNVGSPQVINVGSIPNGAYIFGGAQVSTTGWAVVSGGANVGSTNSTVSGAIGGGTAYLSMTVSSTSITLTANNFNYNVVAWLAIV